MVGPRAWLLNLDADDELALPGSTPSRAIRERTRALVPRLGALVPDGDLVLDEETLEGGVARGLSGRAFCPTPRARALLARAGAELSPAPSFEVLRRVNHRLFSAELGQTLPHARYATSFEEVSTTLAQSSPSGVWILKRPHGFAGRGRRRVVAPLDAGARDFVLATLRRWGGLQLEPWVERRGDFGLHGHLDAEGGLVLGEPTRQENDDAGAWIDSVRATSSELTPSERAALTSATLEAAHALTGAGYFGPFGVDAFRWADASGACFFNPRCEVNARYTMGWAVGMGERRPDSQLRWGRKRPQTPALRFAQGRPVDERSVPREGPGAMADPNYITPEGARKLSEELGHLRSGERPRVVQEVSDAAAQGDRSENAEYIYGKRRLREIDRRMRYLTKRLEAAVVIDPKTRSGDKVFFGATVDVEGEDGVKSTYAIVGEDESDFKVGRISWRSPVGRALLGKRTGDVITVRRPAGEIELEIVDVRYI